MENTLRFFLAVPVVALTAFGCTTSVDSARQAAILCQTNEACPSGFVCRTTLGRCVPQDEVSNTGPTLVDSSRLVVPAVAGIQTAVKIAFSVNVPLGKLPMLRLVDPMGAPSSSEAHEFVLKAQHGLSYEFAFSPGGEEREGTWSVVADLTDDFGTTSEGAVVGPLVLDFSSPVFAETPVASPSVIHAGVETRITIQSDELVVVDVENEPILKLVWPDGTEAEAFEDLSARGSSGFDFVFRYIPNGSEPEESASVVVVWQDLAGNLGEAQSSAVVRCDFTAPLISVLGPTIVPPEGSLLSTVQAATWGSHVTATVASSEVLAQPPSLELRDSANVLVAQSFAVEQQSGQYFVDLLIEPTLGLLDGDYQLVVRAYDNLVGQIGNQAVRQLGLVRFDSTLPPVPDLTQPGAIIYRRNPWGNDASSGEPSFTMEAAAGTFGDDGYSWLIALDRRPVSQAQEMGRGKVSADGSVAAFDVVAVDLPRPFFVVADAAGNLSDADSSVGIQAARVRDVTWTATLNAKITGSVVENPHQAFHVEALQSTLEQSGAAFREADQVQIQGLYGDDALKMSVMGRRIWQPRPTSVSRPSARNQHAVAFDTTRDRLVLFGGFDTLGRSSETWEFDGSFWTRMSPPLSPTARYGHAMTYDPARAEIVVFGGNVAGDLLNDTWVWDGAAWQKRQPINSPPPRELHRMVYDANRQVTVLFGGRVGAAEFNDTWEWDGTDWQNVTPASANPAARDSCSMSFNALTGKVNMYGGVTTQANVFLNDAVWDWDGLQWSPFYLSGARPAPQRNTMVFDAERGVTVLFGQETWERGVGQWAKRVSSNMPPAREYPGGVFSPTQHAVMIFGGGAANDCTAGLCLNDLWAWDGLRWTPLMDAPQSSPAPRDRISMVYHAGLGQSLMFGGSSGGEFFNELWGWAGAGWVLQSNTGPTERFRSTLAYDAQRERLVLFSGIDPQPSACVPNNGLNECGDLWVWTMASGWSDLTPGGLTPPWTTWPAPRSAAAVAYDSDRQKVVLYGGAGCQAGDCTGSKSGTCTDTWEWDAMTQVWEPMISTDNPPALSRHAMAYDIERKRVVLFGGVIDAAPTLNPCSTDGLSNETWEWGLHGAAVCGSASTPCWQVMNVLGSTPDPRGGHTLTYDETRRRVLLFGGQTELVTDKFNDAWEWDGVAWRQLQIASLVPAERFGHGISYDVSRQQMVLFGGVGESETWELAADPEQRPAALFTFDLGFTRTSIAALQRITVTVDADGFGYTNETTGSGLLQNGVTLWAWSAARGEFVVLADWLAGSNTFSTATTQDAFDIITADTKLYLAASPTAGSGNGPFSPQIDVNYIEVVVDLRQ